MPDVVISLAIKSSFIILYWISSKLNIRKIFPDKIFFRSKVISLSFFVAYVVAKTNIKAIKYIINFLNFNDLSILDVVLF